MQVLEWKIRPVTPHVIMFTVLDKCIGLLPISFKRYFVNIAEKIVISAYALNMRHADFDVVRYTMAAIQATCKIVLPSIQAKLHRALQELVEDQLLIEFPESMDLELAFEYTCLEYEFGDPIAIYPKLPK